MRKAEHNLKEIRIPQCEYTLKCLIEEKTTTENKLKESLTTSDYQEVTSVTTAWYDAIFEKVKDRQRSKWDKLTGKKQNAATLVTADERKELEERWVKNL